MATGSETLDPSVVRKYESIRRALSPTARRKVELAARSFAPQLDKLDDCSDLMAAARREIGRQFTGLSRKGIDVLVFYMVAVGASQDGGDR